MRIVALLIAAGAACAQSSSPEQLFRDAVAAQQHGDDALAVRKYQELLKRYPDAVEVRANLGAALAKLERYDEAIEQYRAGAACAQSSGPEQLFRDAVAAQQHGDDALAVRKYQELLKRYPDAVEVRANLDSVRI